jgi:hypothetical protein
VFKYYCLITALILTSCNPVDEKKLSGEYFITENNGGTLYPRNSLNRIRIYPIITDYAFDDEFILIEQTPELETDKALLSGDLFDWFSIYKAFLSDTTIADQYPYFNAKTRIKQDSDIYKIFISRGIGKDSSQDIGISISIADSLIKNDTYYNKIYFSKENYWILSISKDSLFGPYSRQQYLFEKKKLDVSKKLKLGFE